MERFFNCLLPLLAIRLLARTIAPMTSPTSYDLAIIGGGPAGAAAAVYASRKRLKTVLIAESFGGQSVVSEGIENWIGTIKISGNDLAKNLEAHARAYAGDVVDIKTGDRVNALSKDASGMFTVSTAKETFLAKAVLIASGSSRRQLAIPGADTFEHKGVTYCASCDGPVFADQDVAVIGGGNAAFESAAQLLAYCKSVTLINRGDTFRADEVTVTAVLKHPNMKVAKNAELVEVKGDKFVSGLVYKDKTSGETIELPVTGIFVEIGAMPNTGSAKDLVERNQFDAIKVDPKTQRTSCLGIWSAGDCTDGLYHQNNIAAGDSVKALEDIYLWIKAGA
jgi:alkyl hydroperoxide reductase subunit F